MEGLYCRGGHSDLPGHLEQSARASLPTRVVWPRAKMSHTVAYMQRPSGAGYSRSSNTHGQASGFDVAPACVCVGGVAGILQEQAAESRHLLPKTFLEMLLF